MSKAAELAALISSQSALSNRNLIINGAMQVAQRGTSFATMGNGDSQYTLDRFKWQEAGSTTAEMTVTQSSTSPNEFSKSLKVDVTTADTTLGADDLIYIQYKNEGNVLGGIAKGTSDAKPLTLSFYVRSNLTGTFVVYLFDADNTRSVSGTYTINSANTWERKEVNFPADTSGALTIDNSHAMSINWVLGAGSNLKSSSLQTSWGSYDSTALATGSTDITGSTSNEWYITGVQLELGEQATPFEHRSFADDLTACQRYYETLIIGAGNFDIASTERTADDDRAKWDFKVRKRANCTAALGAGGSWGTGTPTFYNGLDNVNFNRAGIFNLNGTGGTIGLVADSEL